MSVIQEIFENSQSNQGTIVRSIITLPDGKWANIPLRMFFSVCDNAACSCSDLAISIVRSGEPNTEGSALRFSVDVTDHKLAEKDKASDAAQDVIRHFDNEDWHALWRAFSDIKLQHTENMDFDRTMPDFPMQQAIESEGELVPYEDILPYGRKFFVESSEGTILLDEQYCLRRGCDCDLVAVSFIPVKENKQVGEAAMVEVRYRSGKAVAAENGSFAQTPQQILKIFLEMYPDLLKQFSKRHKQLTNLYSIYRKANPKIEIKTHPKVGRNDPCTCGSGKKYKKCCIDQANSVVSNSRSQNQSTV